MKKAIALIMSLTLLLFSVGCAKKSISFNIRDAAKITIFHDGSGRSAEITDAQAIKRITDNINSLCFERDGSSKNTEGLGYYLSWYDSDGQLIDKIIVGKESRISYNDYFYNVSDDSTQIDISFIDELLGDIE